MTLRSKKTSPFPKVARIRRVGVPCLAWRVTITNENTFGGLVAAKHKRDFQSEEAAILYAKQSLGLSKEPSL